MRSYGAPRSSRGMPEPGGGHAADPHPDAIRGDILARGRGRQRIDVAGQRPRRPDPRRGHRQHAGAAPDVGDPARHEPRLRQPVERKEAALRRRVVPGAEGLRRLDLEPDPVDRHPTPVVPAEDHEAPGRDRGQLGADLRHPVAVVDALDDEVRRAMHLRQQREPGRVRPAVEQPAGVPAPRSVVVVVHLARHRRRRQVVERVAQRRRGGLADDDGGGAVERHGGPRKRWPARLGRSAAGRQAAVPIGQLTPVPPMPQ